MKKTSKRVLDWRRRKIEDDDFKRLDMIIPSELAYRLLEYKRYLARLDRIMQEND